MRRRSDAGGYTCVCAVVLCLGPEWQMLHDGDSSGLSTAGCDYPVLAFDRPCAVRGDVGESHGHPRSSRKAGRPSDSDNVRMGKQARAPIAALRNPERTEPGLSGHGARALFHGDRSKQNAELPANKRKTHNDARSIVSALCAGLLLCAPAGFSPASEVSGPITLAQIATGVVIGKDSCAYSRDRKTCGGTCPRKGQQCQKISATICTCK